MLTLSDTMRHRINPQMLAQEIAHGMLISLEDHLILEAKNKVNWSQTTHDLFLNEK